MPTSYEQQQAQNQGYIPGQYDYSGVNTNPYGQDTTYDKGYLSFGETSGLSSQQLLAGFGLAGEADKGMVQSFEDQYGWKTGQMKQNMYAGVGQAMGTAGTSLQQMREQSSSLASQSGLRRGRGAGLQQENIYDQYTQGLSGLQSQTQQGIESMKHQWYDELTGTMAQIKDRQDG